MTGRRLTRRERFRLWRFNNPISAGWELIVFLTVCLILSIVTVTVLVGPPWSPVWSE